MMKLYELNMSYLFDFTSEKISPLKKLLEAQSVSGGTSDVDQVSL